ncbi:MAG: response regulator [Candidatus Entotheonellia bacterium]
MSLTTVVLADDHPVVRQGLRALLQSESDVWVIGEAGDGLEAVQLVERLQPHVLLLDLMLPGINGLEVTRQVCQQTSQTRVIILSMHANEAYVLSALRHGAAGYVLKDAHTTDVVRALREVVSGRRYLSPPLSERAIETYIQRDAAAALDRYEMLTVREREILSLSVEGHTIVHIAERLFISPRTVETHRANLMRKLGVHSQTDLVRYAIQRGIVPLAE